MEATTTQDARPDYEATDRRLMRGAGIGLILLVPPRWCASSSAWPPSGQLASQSWSQAAWPGEGCSSIQGQWILYAFVGSVVVGVLAVAIPLRRLPSPTARGWLVHLHVFAHGTMASMILARAW